jgi:hypothetical protein
MAVLHKENTRTALDFLLKAVEVWPNMNVQFKLLQSETNCLPQQLWVMIQVIEKQPLRFIRSNILALTEVIIRNFWFLNLLNHHETLYHGVEESCEI